MLIVMHMWSLYYTTWLQAPLSDDELVKMLSGMGMNEGGLSEEGMMPMMQQMMKQLLSKDVLYPSLKDISAKVSSHLSFSPFLSFSLSFFLYYKLSELAQKLAQW